MDPHLSELLAEGAPADEVSAVMRLRHPDRVPVGVRVVTQFHEIVTCRLRRADIPAVRADPRVVSLKAPDPVIPERPVSEPPTSELPEAAAVDTDERRPRDVPTGRGVVVGVVDWGADVAHPNFRDAEGRTRLRALWDQRRRPGEEAAAPYGYGVIHWREDIDRALGARDPYAALGYSPRDSDPDGSGSHGSHVLDIAAGSGHLGPAGIAPEADLVFVHLAPTGSTGLATLGDSVALLEAVDFIARVAGDLPWVINLSVGNHGGPHDGSTLVEQGFDRAVLGRPGRAIVQSCGNYFERDTHVFGALRPGQTKVLTWDTDSADRTANELEVWYSGRDRFTVEVRAPGDVRSAALGPGEDAALMAGGETIAHIYHRAFDPNNGDHHINVFLHPAAPPGSWQVILTGDDVVDGRYHGWIERDEGCRACQSRFPAHDTAPFSTTGTICNGFRNVAVGAYDAHAPDRRSARFSSVGPTRDGRQKPDLCAPGVAVLAARSSTAAGAAPMLTRKSGTSMAAPHVTGCIAVMFAAAPRPLSITETRRLLLSATSPAEDEALSGPRLGSGYLDVAAAARAAARVDDWLASEALDLEDEELPCRP